MALCTVAGIGGGGIANSMLIYFFKFETKPAVAISSFSILVCTTMRFFYNFKTRHPEKPNMNVLDYGLASIMMPTTLAGSQIGGYVLKAFPSIYIQALLTLLLAFLTFQTTKKGLQLHRKELAEKERAKSVGAGEHDDVNQDGTGHGGKSVTSSQNSAKSINELDQTDEIEPLKMSQTDDRPEESVVLKTLVIGGKTFMIGDKSQSQVGNRLAQA